MTRLARTVVPDLPHHVTQRGNRGERTFFHDSDYRLYLELLRETSAEASVEVWAYCLMPNHVHLILTPSDPDGLRKTLAWLHRRYTNHINQRNGWTGHVWQGRFGSVVMDETHLINAARYVSLNPVRARLVSKAQDWPWSSVRAHLAGEDDAIVRVAPILNRMPNFAEFIEAPFDEQTAFTAIRQSETTGRPLGSREWLMQLEQASGRTLAAAKRGPKAKPR